MGLTEVLTLIFIVLKLTNVIAWSWWLVLLPEIIAFALYVIMMFAFETIFVKTGKRIKKGKW